VGKGKLAGGEASKEQDKEIKRTQKKDEVRREFFQKKGPRKSWNKERGAEKNDTKFKKRGCAQPQKKNRLPPSSGKGRGV